MLTIIEKTGKHSAICKCSICKQPYTTKDRFMSAKVHAGDQCDACKNLPRNPPTQALLHQLFNYDPDTGALTYKRDFNRRHKGEDATTSMNGGYRVVNLDKSYLAHRIIWMMHTGRFPEFIDHINHDRTDNRWENLRDVAEQINAQNKSINSNNTSGYLGVSWMPRLQKFRANITVNRKQIHLGLFETAEAAHAARQAANKEHNFHTNHGNQ